MVLPELIVMWGEKETKNCIIEIQGGNTKSLEKGAGVCNIIVLKDGLKFFDISPRRSGLCLLPSHLVRPLTCLELLMREEGGNVALWLSRPCPKGIQLPRGSLGMLAVWVFPPRTQPWEPATLLAESWVLRSERQYKGLVDSPQWAYSRTRSWRTTPPSQPGGSSLQRASPFQPFKSSKEQPQTWSRDNHPQDAPSTPTHRMSGHKDMTAIDDMTATFCPQVRVLCYAAVDKWDTWWSSISEFPDGLYCRYSVTLTLMILQTVRHWAKISFW